jgi:predicted O-methyltransferase YrrM
MPFPDEKTPGGLYYFNNDFFSCGDATVLFCLLRHWKPRRFIEVGSGFSSCAVLDTLAKFQDQQTRFTTIDPWPERLLDQLPPGFAGLEVRREQVQQTPLALLDELHAGDVLFVDSSHVYAPGSDVEFLIDVVLPRLRSGVIVHFHDIFWPFEYPVEWRDRNWNECQRVRDVVASGAVQVVLFNHYLSIHYADQLYAALPTCRKNPGGSLWLRIK